MLSISSGDEILFAVEKTNVHVDPSTSSPYQRDLFIRHAQQTSSFYKANFPHLKQTLLELAKILSWAPELKGSTHISSTTVLGPLSAEPYANTARKLRLLLCASPQDAYDSLLPYFGICLSLQQAIGDTDIKA